MAELTGIEGATAAAVAAAGAPPTPAPAEQLVLLPVLTPAELQQGMPLRAKGSDLDATPEAEARRPGTRRGVPNKRTEAWVQFILARYRSPLIGLAEIAARDVRELAAELSCTRLEAFQLQFKAHAELAPYLHQKLPQAHQIDARGVAHLSIDLGFGGDAPTGEEGELLDLFADAAAPLPAPANAPAKEGE